MGFSGFCVGTTYPSRDMLVRAVTPPGAYGRVFGFVSTGFNIGASIAPIMYGMLMDHGQPRAVFLVSAAVSVLCVSTVTIGFGRKTYRRSTLRAFARMPRVTQAESYGRPGRRHEALPL